MLFRCPVLAAPLGYSQSIGLNDDEKRNAALHGCGFHECQYSCSLCVQVHVALKIDHAGEIQVLSWTEPAS